MNVTMATCRSGRRFETLLLQECEKTYGGNPQNLSSTLTCGAISWGALWAPVSSNWTNPLWVSRVATRTHVLSRHLFL